MATYDGDTADLTTSDTIYPEYSGYQTAYGHADSSSDADKGSLYLSNSGYFTLSSTGNTKSYIYDNTTATWVKSSGGDVAAHD